MEIYGIDVSAYQGKPDWSKVKSSIQFAILRITERNGIDSSFEHNYKGCTDNGIPVGVYKFSYALNESEAIQEAKGVLNTLNNRKLDFPVFYDLEWATQRALGKDSVTKIAKAFLKEVESAGYKVGIYSNKDWYNNAFYHEQLPYDYWMAAYPYEDNGVIVERLRPDVGIGWQYSSKGSVPGIQGNVDMNVFYKDYTVTDDTKKEENTMTESQLRQTYVDVMKGWIGLSQAAGTHTPIIDLYNSHTPLARGYKVQYYDAYCATTVSAAAIKLGITDIIPTECGCGQQIALFQSLGRWIESDSYIPSMGDIIYYDWDDNGVGDCVGWPEHVGVVASVSGNVITVVEGNMGDNGVVGYRNILVNGRYIRGYGIPDYAKKAPSLSAPASTWKATGTATSTADNVAVYKDVGKTKIGIVNKGNRFEIDGTNSGNYVHVKVSNIGVGYILKTYVKNDTPTTTYEKLKYTVKRGDTISSVAKDFGITVNNIVNLNKWMLEGNTILVARKVTDSSSTSNSSGSSNSSSTATPAYQNWVGKVTANTLNVRTGAGTSYGTLSSYPQLALGNLVDVIGEKNAADGSKWYQIRIAGKYVGYVSSDYIKRK